MRKKIWSRLTAYALTVVLLCSQAISAVPATEEDTADTQAGVFSTAWQLTEEANTNGAAYNGYIFKLRDGVAITLDADEAEGIDTVEYSPGVYTAEQIDQIEEFVSEGFIEYIEPNYMMKLFDSDISSATAPNDRYYESYQWNLDMMNVQDVWGYGIEGQDLDEAVDMNYDGSYDNDPIVIAVIDSGLKNGHEDIDWSRILPGENFNPDATSTDDVLGHGTFVTGLIMATKDNGLGIAGIAQNVQVMPLKVFQENEVETSVIVSAINYATQQKTQFDSTSGTQGTNISVINMSLGGESSDTTMKAAVEASIAAGIIVVCAAGNDGNTAASYPAQYAIGVGSVNSAGQVSDYSQRLSSSNGTGYANKVWVSAPGEDVVSLYCESTTSYSQASGTSFSSPEVAALAAICKSLDNSMNHAAFQQLLKDTAVYKTSGLGLINGQDVGYGWGMVDFAATVNALIGDLSGTSEVTVEIKNEAGTVIPDASYAIYELNEDETKGAAVQTNADGTYTLQRGRRYMYEASAFKYDAQSGIFAVLTAERTLTITLQGQTYLTYFVARNTRNEYLTDLTITVKRQSDGATIVKNTDGSFNTRNGTYSYTVAADGYFPTTGTFTIDDVNNYDTLVAQGNMVSVLLYGDIDVCSMTFDVIGENGTTTGTDITSGTTVTLFDSDGDAVDKYSDGAYKLVPGVYHYTAENSAYRTVTGGFIIDDTAKGTVSARTIYMTEGLYYVYLDVMPLTVKNPNIIVTNGLGQVETPISSADVRVYRLPNGTYCYTVSASGYNTYTGTFTVADGKVQVDVQMARGSATIDDGTTGTGIFVTVGSAAYSLTKLQGYPTEAERTKDGQTVAATGITLADVIANFSSKLRTPTSVDVLLADGTSVTVQADAFGTAMIVWQAGGAEGLWLVDGAGNWWETPKVVTVNYHEHTEVMTVIQEATCTEAGIAKYICKDCGNERTVEIPALGHDFVNGVCTRCGASEDLSGEETVLELGDRKLTMTELQRYPTSASYTAVNSYYGSQTHTVVGITIADLVRYYGGDNCIQSIKFISNYDGAYVTISSSQYSSAMLAWLVDGLPGSSYDTDNGLRLAVDNGPSGYWIYSPYWAELTTVDGGHSYETVVTAPTCSEQGYTTKTCTACGHVEITDYVPATGEHEWGDDIVLEGATCEEGGAVIHYCVNCGKSEVVTSSDGALGHDFVNGVCTHCGLVESAAEGDLIPGDVNGDGKANAIDAMLVLRAAVMEITLNARQIAAADVNGDGAVNSADAVLILRYSIGLGSLTGS